MKIALALFGAPRDLRTKLAAELQEEFSKPSCSVHDLEGPVKDAARALFGLPSGILAWHPEEWRDPESLHYGKTVEQILRATYKFASSLGPSVLVDRIWEEIRAQAPTCPYCIVRDGRSIAEWEALKKGRKAGDVIIGILVKTGSKSPFDEDEFDVVVKIKRGQEEFSEAVKAIADWTYEVHGTAEKS